MNRILQRDIVKAATPKISPITAAWIVADFLKKKEQAHQANPLAWFLWTRYNKICTHPSAVTRMKHRYSTL